MYVRTNGGLHKAEEKHQPGGTQRLLDCTQTAWTTGGWGGGGGKGVCVGVCVCACIFMVCVEREVRVWLLVVCSFFFLFFFFFIFGTSITWIFLVYLFKLVNSLTEWCLWRQVQVCRGGCMCRGTCMCLYFYDFCVEGGRGVGGWGVCIVYIFSISFLSDTSITWLFLVYLFKHVISLTEWNLWRQVQVCLCVCVLVHACLCVFWGGVSLIDCLLYCAVDRYHSEFGHLRPTVSVRWAGCVCEPLLLV